MSEAVPSCDFAALGQQLAGYGLGCPLWQNADWRGTLYPAQAKPTDFLRHYAAVFNAVEGNTTFYGLPKAATVEKWRDSTPMNFAFCCKLPQEITHQKRLRHTELQVQEFFTRLAPLEARLQVWVQLPAFLGPNDLPTLLRFLDSLPTGFTVHVEVRHPQFFDKSEAERQLNGGLMARHMNRVMLDSRPLFSVTGTDPLMGQLAVQNAQKKKPRLPVHALATGMTPMIRWIGHPDLARNRPWFTPWIAKWRQWREEGRTPLLFVHTPDNRQAPELGYQCHVALNTT